MSQKFPKVTAEIIKIEGGQRCSFGHKVGEKFTFDEFGPDKKMCGYALEALMPAQPSRSASAGKLHPNCLQAEALRRPGCRQEKSSTGAVRIRALNIPAWGR